MANRRAYSDHDGESNGRYSDDFVSDESRTPTPTRRTAGKYYEDRFRSYRGRGGGQRGRVRGRGAKRGGRGTSRNSEPADMRKGHDTITQRVLSASRNRVNEYKNKVEELKLQIRDLQIENRLYKKMQFRQEKALKGFEDKENDLPNILEKHNNEIRSLKEQNRRMKEKYEKSDRYLRDAEDELERVKKQVKKYKEVVEEKQLLEREELSKKVTKAEIDMEERDVKIKELQRHIETLKKNHRHELGIEAARQKEMKRQMEQMEEENAKIGTQLKEKEKALEYKNIYSKTIEDNAQGQGTPGRKPQKKASSMTDLTPRDKAKFYAEKKREELKKQKQIKADQEKKKREQWEEEEREREMNAANVSSPTPASTPPPFSFNSIDRDLEEREREEAWRLEEEQRRWREREREEAAQKEEIERRRRDLERRQEDNQRREKEDRERREREEQKRREFEREGNERKERDRKQREEKDRREQEESERRERLESERREKEKAEQERRLRMEREKAENDPKIQEERRKKDELLKKLQAMDGQGSAGATTATKRDLFNTSPQHKRVKENSLGGSSGDGWDSPSRRSSRKEYSFTKPVNNLHQGKPSHDDVDLPPRVGRRRPSKDGDDIGGYQPSFGPSKGGASEPPISSKPMSIFDDDEPAFRPAGNKLHNTTNKENKSSNLLENLFGPTANKDTSNKRSDENETFFVTSKSPQLTKKSSEPVFPWDNNPTSTNKTNGNIGGGSTIYGGGAALIDDEDFSPNKNKVLPRRGRQTNVNTFNSKPTVTAVDAFDDDFEEVVL